MSDIIIKGMEMPKNCRECRLMTADYGCVIVGAVGYALTEGRRCKDCPLVPVPPHGRLIDAEAVAAEIDSFIDNMAYSYSYLLREEQSQREHGMVIARDIVCDAPTIIEAEEKQT